MKLSVVMSVYNCAPRLRATIDSILAQTETDFELLIVDDGSIDDTPSILGAYMHRDRRVRVLAQTNTGLTRALINACSEAVAPLIARHDCGDVSHPERFARQLALFRDDVVLTSCAVRYIGPRAEPLYTSRGDGEETREALLHADAAHIHGIPHHGSAMFSRAAYRAAGGYREQFRFAQDLDLWIRMARRGRIVIDDEILYDAVIEPRAISSLQRDAQVALTRIAVALRDGGDEAQLLAEAARVVPAKGGASEAAGLYFIAKCLRRNGDPAWRAYLRRALAQNPLHLRSWASLISGR
jgi:glycosyltransferase involved in cell wall biosynthesis